VDLADQPEDAKLSGGHETAADGENEGKKDQISTGLTPLHCCGLIQSYVFR
jgi:hypothetical protein